MLKEKNRLITENALATHIKASHIQQYMYRTIQSHKNYERTLEL